ncbi:MAG: protein phosphatase 2C domain-containing protein [Kofleriaceae bacterium]
MSQVRVAGETHVGLARTANEDVVLVEPTLGCFGVFDGMGGAQAGDVAARCAREAVIEYVRAQRGRQPVPALLEGALNAACAAVFGLAQRDRDLRGMGTTAVLAMMSGEAEVVIAHVGDSRAYLWRDGRLAPLTFDHTIVAELVARGALAPEEVDDHPYRSVLSRNLGAAASCKVDVATVPLVAGDRVLLCTDGLHGFATHEAIQQLLSAGDAPAATCRELVELALRGGGGDNVSMVVLDAAGAAPSATHVMRTTGADAWRQHRPRLIAAVRRRELMTSPVVAQLGPAAALELLGADLADAVFHDLERSTAVNAWTFAHGLAEGWLGAVPGDVERWPPLRALLDGLVACADEVVAAVKVDQPRIGRMLEAAVGRVFNVVELAVATVLAEQVRALDGELIGLQAAAAGREDTTTGFSDSATVPFVRPSRAATTDGGGPALHGALRGAARLARDAVGDEDAGLVATLLAIEGVAVADDLAAAAAASAHELFGVRTVDEAGMAPLFDAADRARAALVAAVAELGVGAAVRAATARRLGLAQERIGAAVAALVIEAAEPASARLRETQAATRALRERLAEGDRQLARLERASATIVDPPGGRR